MKYSDHITQIIECHRIVNLLICSSDKKERKERKKRKKMPLFRLEHLKGTQDSSTISQHIVHSLFGVLGKDVNSTFCRFLIPILSKSHQASPQHAPHRSERYFPLRLNLGSWRAQLPVFPFDAFPSIEQDLFGGGFAALGVVVVGLFLRTLSLDCECWPRFLPFEKKKTKISRLKKRKFEIFFTKIPKTKENQTS